MNLYTTKCKCAHTRKVTCYIMEVYIYIREEAERRYIPYSVSTDAGRAWRRRFSTGGFITNHPQLAYARKRKNNNVDHKRQLSENGGILGVNSPLWVESNPQVFNLSAGSAFVALNASPLPQKTQREESLWPWNGVFEFMLMEKAFIPRLIFFFFFWPWWVMLYHKLC